MIDCLSKFDEWWAKMNGWLNVNWYVIEKWLYEAVATVLSWLKRLKARVFAQVQLQKGQIYMWETLEQEITSSFKGNLVKEWALKKLKHMCQAQGQLINTFLITWEAEYIKSNIGNSQAIHLLETHPETYHWSDLEERRTQDY